MRRTTDPLASVLGAFISLAMVVIAAVVLCGMASHAHQSDGNGYYAKPWTIAAQLIVGTLDLFVCATTCSMALRQLRGRDLQRTVAAGAAASVSLAAVWVFLLFTRLSS